jgi:hypothetical protein
MVFVGFPAGPVWAGRTRTATRSSARSRASSLSRFNRHCARVSITTNRLPPSPCSDEALACSCYNQPWVKRSPIVRFPSQFWLGLSQDITTKPLIFVYSTMLVDWDGRLFEGIGWKERFHQVPSNSWSPWGLAPTELHVIIKLPWLAKFSQHNHSWVIGNSWFPWLALPTFDKGKTDQKSIYVLKFPSRELMGMLGSLGLPCLNLLRAKQIKEVLFPRKYEGND